MRSSAITIVALISIHGTVFAKIPSYIHVCKRNDPKLSECVRNSTIGLRYKLRAGIPELDIPPLDPLKIEDFRIHYENSFLTLKAKDYYVRGVSDYQLDEAIWKLPIDFVQFKVRFPKLLIESYHEIKANFFNVEAHGKGQLYIETVDIRANCVLKAKLVHKGGKKYVKSDAVELDVVWDNYKVTLSRGFFKTPSLADLFVKAIESNKPEIIKLIKPKVEDTARKLVLSIFQKMFKRFTYDELLPPN